MQEQYTYLYDCFKELQLEKKEYENECLQRINEDR
jgi:hypothetical protein